LSAKKAQSQQLYQELEQNQATSLLSTAAQKMVKPTKQRLLTPRKRAEIDAALTASANIEQMVAAAASGLTPAPPAVLRDNSNVSVRKSSRKASSAKGGGNVDDV
jgi:hypothetical protein